MPVLAWLALALGTRVASAEPPVGAGPRALPGLVHLELPTQSAEWAVVAAAGYGWLDAEAADQRGSRGFGSLAAAWAPLPHWAVALDFNGRFDRFGRASNGPEWNLYGEPRLTLRYATDVDARFSLGAELDARFIGKEAPSFSLGATSPSLRGLAAYRAQPQLWFALNVGFGLDNSARAVPHPSVVSANDRRTLAANSWNTVPWGLGAVYAFEAKPLELFGELSGDVLIGSPSAGTLRSPLRLAAGSRFALLAGLYLGAVAEVSLSRRLPEVDADRLIPVEPRWSLGLTLGYRAVEPPVRPAPLPPPVPEQPAAAPEPPPAPAIASSKVSGTVVDEGGHPLADVTVTLRAGGSEVTSLTFADGTYSFEQVPLGPFELEFETAGFDRLTLPVAEDGARAQEITLRAALPAGQVRGTVTDIQGKPLAATVTVQPGKHVVSVGAEGGFELELPPGQYTVRFEAPGFGAQKRSIRVRDHAVVILNIALIR